MTFWIVYSDPNTVWNHLDKFVVNVVEEKELDTYQKILAGDKGSCYEVIRHVTHLQPFVRISDTNYYVRQYDFWSNSQ